MYDTAEIGLVEGGIVQAVSAEGVQERYHFGDFLEQPMENTR